MEKKNMRLKPCKWSERSKEAEENANSLSNGKDFHKKKLPGNLRSTWVMPKKPSRTSIEGTHRTIPLPSPPSPPLPSSSASPWSVPFTPTSTLPLYTPHPQLYSWDNKVFHKEYLRKLEHNWQHWKSAHAEAYTSD